MHKSSLRRSTLVSTALLLAIACAPAQGADVAVAPGSEPELTIYNGDLGLVRERRIVRLTDGENRLAFGGVSRNLQAETADLALDANDKVKPADLRIFDQTFAFNLMSQESLLEQSVGKEISIVTTNPGNGRDITERAKVLSVQNGLVLEIAGKIHTGISPGRIVFDALPPNLRATPTLLVTASGPAGVDIPLELSYLTAGLGWHADYVANYDTDSNRLDLTGWATVTNTTGISFNNAKLKLAAGDINRVQQPQPPRPQMRMAMAASAKADAMPEAQSLGGLNLYPVARPVTLGTGETKQLALLRATSIAAKRDAVVRGQTWFYTTQLGEPRQEGRAEIEVVVKNEGRARPARGKAAEPAPAADTAGLGVALPPGVVRVYGQDSDGAAQLLGEDRIDHTAEGSEIRLHLGRDIDLPVVREQLSFVHASDQMLFSVWRVTVRNTKSKAANVRVVETIPGAWDVTKENLPHTKNAAGQAEWALAIPAKGTAILEYSVRTTP